MSVVELGHCQLVAGGERVGRRPVQRADKVAKATAEQLEAANHPPPLNSF
ncbi:MAG: hypothetical protein QM723_05310 [Myxococcaceae bacterium]